MKKTRYAGIEAAYKEQGVNITPTVRADAKADKFVREQNEAERKKRAKQDEEHAARLREIAEAEQAAKKNPKKARSFAQIARDYYGTDASGGAGLIGTSPRGGR